MLKSKELLEKHIEKLCMSIITDTATCNKVYDFAKEKYNIPKGMTSDILCLRVSLSEVSEFILYCFLSSIENVLNINESKINYFYTEKEINMYSKSKYDLDNINFPIRFKMIQVTRDQWVGKISIEVLMKLRESQLINYNINAQRTMQRIIKDNKEIYKITLNETAIKAISNLFDKNIYIPTPFTLNIPLEIESDFYYDKDKCELVINSLRYFDITDGYHRYIAACRKSDSDKNFNYEMELRIVNFSEEKAKQFIYQEDQKTKMKKIDSNSYNLNNPGNLIAERLNQNPMCNLKGLISRNNGIINLGELAGLIDYLYFKGLPKDKENMTIIKVTKELLDNFNMLTEYNTFYLEKKYSYKQLCLVVYIFNQFYNKEKNNMCQIIDNCVNNINLLEDKRFYSKSPKRSIIKDIENLIEKCDEYV